MFRCCGGDIIIIIIIRLIISITFIIISSSCRIVAGGETAGRPFLSSYISDNLTQAVETHSTLLEKHKHTRITGEAQYENNRLPG